MLTAKDLSETAQNQALARTVAAVAAKGAGADGEG